MDRKSSGLARSLLDTLLITRSDDDQEMEIWRRGASFFSFSFEFDHGRRTPAPARRLAARERATTMLPVGQVGRR